MKRNLILISLLFCIGSTKSRPMDSGGFIIKGKITGRDTGYVYLWYRGMDGAVSDSFHLNRGEFIFRGKVWEPTGAIFSSFCFASINRAKYESRNLVEIFIEPCQMSLFVSLDHFKTAQLEGSRSDSDRVRLMRMEEPVERKIQPLMLRYDVVAPLYNTEFKKDTTSVTFKCLKAALDSIDTVLDPLYKEESSIDSAFIVDNPASYFAASMLLRNVSGGSTDKFPDIKKLYDRFPPDIKESSYGHSINYVMESERKIGIGLDPVDFIALNRQGDTIRLIDFKDKKYVLLDFWASWCVPCRNITPVLFKIYSKYHDKIEVISIANHDEETDWLAAIKKDQMDWTQILDNDGSNKIIPDSGTITDAYFINEIPSLILIDKNHKIVKLFGFGGKNNTPIELLNRELEKMLQ